MSTKFETKDETKDLASDIFLYLAENTEASSSFNDNSDIEYSFGKGNYADDEAKAQSEYGRNLVLGKFDIPKKEVNKYDHVSFYLPTVYVSGGQFTRQEYWKNMDDVYKIYILQRALSVLSGTPICNKQLYQTFTDAIYDVNGFDEAYNITNDKYNEIN